MSTQRPDVTDEDIGMRTFEMRKARAVERATERMRQGLGDKWDMLSQPEIELLGWALGELWAFEGRASWESLHFSKLSPVDVQDILGFARELQHRSRASVDTLEDINRVVRERS